MLTREVHSLQSQNEELTKKLNDTDRHNGVDDKSFGAGLLLAEIKRLKQENSKLEEERDAWKTRCAF